MKKKSSAVKMALGTAMITPAISARTPASASSGGNTGSRWLPWSAAAAAVARLKSAANPIP